MLILVHVQIYAKATLLEHIDKQLSLAEESQLRHQRKIDQIEKVLQWNKSNTATCGPELTDLYREVAALQR